MAGARGQARPDPARHASRPATSGGAGELRAEGPIYTSAFILCANKAYGHERKYLNHLDLLRDMMRRGDCRKPSPGPRRLKDVYERWSTSR